MKLLPLILILSTSAHAQFSFLKGNSSKVKITYECNGQMVDKKLKFKLNDEVLSSNAETECPESFVKALRIKISEAKQKCSPGDKEPICVSDTEALIESVKLTQTQKESKKTQAPKENHSVLSALSVGSEDEAQKLFDEKISAVIQDPSNCTDLPTTEDSSRLNIMVRYPKVFASGIDKLQAANSSCLNRLLGNYKSLLPQKSVENKPEIQAWCSQNPSHPACLKVKENLQQIDTNIRKLIAAQSGKDAKEWLDSGNCKDTPFKDYDDLGQRIKEYEKEMKCVPLKNNSERIVLDQRGNPIYRLRKDTQGNIETALAINITGPAVDGVTPSHMFERIQKCLKTASKFIAPPGVKGFDLKVMSPEEAKAQGVPVHNVGLITSNTPKNQNIVSYSDNYRTDIPCGTIAHEVMHLLGLPDEYRHDGSSQCFTPPPLPSLMGGIKSDDKNGNWSENVPQTLECECSSDECKKIFSGSDNDLKRFISQPAVAKLNNTARKMKCTETYKNEKWTLVKDKQNLQRMVLHKEESNVIHYSLYNHFGENLNSQNIRCECDQNDQSCLEEMKKEVKMWKRHFANKDNSEFCPTGFKRKSLFPNDAEGTPGTIKLGENSFKYFTKTKHTGMLLPAQVALIASGHCPNVSRKYSACYAWGSYNDGDERSDLPDDVREANADGIGQCKNNSSPSCVRVSCSNRPKYCDDLSTYLNP